MGVSIVIAAAAGAVVVLANEAKKALVDGVQIAAVSCVEKDTDSEEDEHDDEDDEDDMDGGDEIEDEEAEEDVDDITVVAAAGLDTDAAASSSASKPDISALPSVSRGGCSVEVSVDAALPTVASSEVMDRGDKKRDGSERESERDVSDKPNVMGCGCA